MAKLEDLVLKITADSRELKRELKRVESANGATTRKLSNQWSKSSASASGFGSKIKGLKVALAAVASSVIIRGISQQITTFEEMADSIDKTSKKLGVGVEDLQNWRFAANEAGVSSQTFDMGLQRLIRRTGEAALGAGEARGALRELNVEVRDSQGAMRTSSEIFEDVIRKLGKVESATLRTAVAQKLFDSEGVALVNLSTNFDTAVARAEEFGVALDEDVIRSLVRTKDEAEALGKQLDQRLSGSFSKFAILGLAIKQGLVDSLDGFDQTIESSDTLREAFENITPPALLDDVEVIDRRIGRASGALEDLNAQLRRFVENSNLPEAALASQVGGLTSRIAAASRELARLEKRKNEIQNPVPDTGPVPTISSLAPEDEKAKREARELTRAQRELNSVLQAGRDPAERLALQMERLTRDYQAGLISSDNFVAGQKSIEKQFVNLARNTEKSAKSLVDVMDGLGDAFVGNFSRSMADMLLTGELTFQSLAESFSRDFTAAVIQSLITSSISSVFGSTAGGGGLLGGLFGGGKAAGGPIQAGVPYLVGEKGPELIVPSASGFVIPNGGLQGPSQVGALAQAVPPAAVSVTVINETDGRASVSERTGPSGQREIQVLISQAVSGEIHQGGPIARAMDARFNARPRGT